MRKSKRIVSEHERGDIQYSCSNSMPCVVSIENAAMYFVWPSVYIENMFASELCDAILDAKNMLIQATNYVTHIMDARVHVHNIVTSLTRR